MTWITTHSGRQVDQCDPQPDQFCIEDIAHSLSMLCRFTGNARQFYSVAEHAVRVSRACPPHLRLQGLLDDAQEAYVNDWSTPLKASLSECAIRNFREMEARLIAAIGEALGIELHHDPVVKHFDRAVFRAESELLLPELVAGYLDLPLELLPPIVPWSQRKAEEIFLSTFRRLTEPAAMLRRVFELVAA